MATPKEHIQQIRKLKFSIGGGGGAQSSLSEDLHEAVKNLYSELYEKDAQFLNEIIQNAEDNEYMEGVEPSLEFVITSRDITLTGAPSTLLIFNNEKGFSPTNIDSICSFGRSTKRGLIRQQRGYIGEKGIGFKSVFMITARPYIFSNGYQIRFNEDPCPHCNVAYMVPEWVQQNPTVAELQMIYGYDNPLPTTIIVLPLKPDKVRAVKTQLSNMDPEVLLFLSKIKGLSVREDNEDPKLNTINSVSISSETNFVTKKDSTTESYSLHLSAVENSLGRKEECSYHIWRQRFPVKQENIVERRKEIKEWVITLAFPNGQRLNRRMASPGIYAFLPTKMVTNFPFVIHADFVLSSSRETILLDNKWNQGILDCVSSAFVNAFVCLIKTSEGAPVSTLIRMFEFLPVNNSWCAELNVVRDAIKMELFNENIVPSEHSLEEMYLYKPSEVGRIMPSFWSILIKARTHGVRLHSLAAHGKYPLSSEFDMEHDRILNFLGVSPMDHEWYTQCIWSCNMVVGVPEDVYLELLLFVSGNWSHIKNTNIKNIPLLKYVCQDGNEGLWSLNEATKLGGERIWLSSQNDCILWFIEWNKEFRYLIGRYYMPIATQRALLSRKGVELCGWLRCHAKVNMLDVYGYADLLFKSIRSDKSLAIASAHFLFHSHLKGYLSKDAISELCKKLPLVDSDGVVTTKRNGVLVPANGSNWVKLLGSNPWREKYYYIDLGEEYLCEGRRFAADLLYTPKKVLLEFLTENIGASDIPSLCPPDEAFPSVSSPLSKENTFLLLDWIRHLRSGGKLKQIRGKFLRCIKEGSWVRTCSGGSSSVCYKPPSQSFLIAAETMKKLQQIDSTTAEKLVEIPLIDEDFYGSRLLLEYKEELEVLGVKFDIGKWSQFMGGGWRLAVKVAAMGAATATAAAAMVVAAPAVVVAAVGAAAAAPAVVVAAVGAAAVVVAVL